MDAFSLLKYWRGGGGGGSNVSVTGDGGANARTTASSTTTIITAVSNHMSETDGEDNDEGPFFDLEFTVPDEDDGDDYEHAKNEENEDCDSDGSDGEDDSTDQNVSISPSDDLFFKGRLVPVEPSSLDLNHSETNSKLQFPVSLLKSATKFRVMMLKFKKSKSNVSENTDFNGSVSAKEELKHETQEQQEQSQAHGSKFFSVKFKVEEVPIVSLFMRDNSSKAANHKAQKQNSDEFNESASSDERRFSKEAMQRYLKKVKPLYVRVSKRYGEKLRFSGQLSLSGAAKAGLAVHPPSTAEQRRSPVAKSEKEPTPEATEAPAPSNVKSQKLQSSLPAGLRVVCKHLGKSRSASAVVAAAPPGAISSKRRDDSLLQQQDGIQSAILHCKRSFKASRDLEASILARSVSDKSYKKCVNGSSSVSEAKETCK